MSHAFLEAAKLAGSLGGTVYVSGGATEPVSLLRELDGAGLLDGVRLATALVPGIEGSFFSGIGPRTSLQVPLRAPFLPAGPGSPRISHLPIHYTDYFRYHAGSDVSALVVGVSRPRNGKVSLSLTNDFAPALLRRGDVRAFAAVHEELPWPVSAEEWPVERFSAFLAIGGPLPTYPRAPVNAVFERIGARVAELVDDGDTVQAGIGAAPAAALRALRHHRHLAFHSGLATAEAMELLECGALGRGMATNVAVGDQAFYRAIAADDRVRFRPVDQTHSPAVLARLPRLAAINGAIEVDLLGQVNSEMMAGRQVTGHGGIADFFRGARLSEGGRSIVVLPATAAGGKRSRIVATLPEGCVVSVHRADVDYVVTENGIADLRYKDVDGRAKALMAVADPGFREELERRWSQLRADS